MKRSLTVLAILVCLSSLAQNSPTLSPGFKPTEEDSHSIKGYTLTAAYYPIKDNINKRTSIGTTADKPTLEQVALAIRYQAADCFLLSKKGEVVKMIIIYDYPQKQFLVMTPGDVKMTSFPNPLQGDISENRANELVKAGFDPKARIEDGKLSFNSKEYSIVSNAVIKKAIIDLIGAQHWAGN
jgi:hypothetical protein